MTVLCTTLAITLLVASIAAHEWAHLDAMRRLGVDVEEFALGFGPALCSRTLGSGLKVSVRVIPLGGFVMPRDARQIRRLSARDNARICGAGVWVNCALGLALLGFGGLLSTSHHVTHDLVFLALGVALWLLRRPLAPWILVLGALCIALTVYVVIQPPIGPSGAPVSVFAGPIEFYKLLVTSSLGGALISAGAASLAIGLINSAPLPPLDGGHLVARFLRDHVGERAYRVSMLAGAGIFLTSAAVTLLHDVATDIFGIHFL